MAFLLWAQTFLVAERKRKLEALKLLENGTIRLGRRQGGEYTDATGEAIERNRENIAEIEEILTSAGIDFND